MFRSLIELEMITRDRVATMEAREARAAQMREVAAAVGRTGATSPNLTGRVRHGLGRGLISLGEHLAERPSAPPPVAARQLTSARPR